MKVLPLIASVLFMSLLGLSPVFSQLPKTDEAKKEEFKKNLFSADEQRLPLAITKPLPESIADLKAIQEQTKKVLKKVMSSVVGIQIGGASGSGVIVSKDGIVLTAGHVSGKPGKKCIIILPDGKQLEGKSLGRNPGIDSGMIQITSTGNWDFCEMGQSESLKPGLWCIAIGHPNGVQAGRTPVVRVGRTLNADRNAIATDCTLVGGDSGGPLFDMEGKVIGIHSRIGPSIKSNVHVPIKTYTDTWERLVKGDEIGPAVSPYLGVTRDEDAKDCRLSRITEGSPADKGGLKAGDIVIKFDGKDVKSYDDLLSLLAKKKPGDEVEIIVKRGDSPKNFKIKLEKRG